jgi:hypothetical protein
MSKFQSFAARRAGTLGAFAALVMYVGVATATAEENSTASSGEIGRIDFDHVGTAQKSVEVNLGSDMFGDLFGIGDAALAGVAEALSSSPQAQEGSEAVKMAAEKAAAAREFVSIAKNVVKSVRLRAYEGLADAAKEQASVAAHYESQLKSGGWENTVKARDGDQNVQIAAVRGDGAIKGLFIVASEGNNLVLVNVTCDISPENAKKLTNAAVKAGLQAGLDKHLEHALKHMK